MNDIPAASDRTPGHNLSLKQCVRLTAVPYGALGVCVRVCVIFKEVAYILLDLTAEVVIFESTQHEGWGLVRVSAFVLALSLSLPATSFQPCVHACRRSSRAVGVVYC